MINKSIFQGFICAKPTITVAVFGNLFQSLAGCLGRDLSEPLLHIVDEVRLSLNIARRATEAAVRLVEKNSDVVLGAVSVEYESIAGPTKVRIPFPKSLPDYLPVQD